MSYYHASKKRKERETAAPRKPDKPNQLLAGYMAHEFLTKGTLLGKKWDSAQAEPSRSLLPEQKNNKRERYADVARLVTWDGAHVAGVVNPTELARWIRM